jgi:hypothetical protein
MAMEIYDPMTAEKIDVTGWDLDRMHETLVSLLWTINHDQADRELTPAEADAVTGAGYLPPPNGRGYWTLDEDVRETAARLSQIVDEAIYQRDLPAAMEALAAGQELTLRQRWAYDHYVGEVSESVG